MLQQGSIVSYFRARHYYTVAIVDEYDNFEIETRLDTPSSSVVGNKVGFVLGAEEI